MLWKTSERTIHAFFCGHDLRPLARRQPVHQFVNLAFRPRHSTRPQLHGPGKHALAHKVEEAATLVANAVEDLGETKETLGLVNIGLQLAILLLGVTTLAARLAGRGVEWSV